MAKAVKETKKNNAPGPDGIDEQIKILTEAMTKPLTWTFNKILDTGVIPIQWRTLEIILFHKKGDRATIGNYQPIKNLFSNLEKVSMKILKRRIFEIVDFNQPMKQAGF